MCGLVILYQFQYYSISPSLILFSQPPQVSVVVASALPEPAPRPFRHHVQPESSMCLFSHGAHFPIRCSHSGVAIGRQFVWVIGTGVDGPGRSYSLSSTHSDTRFTFCSMTRSLSPGGVGEAG